MKIFTINVYNLICYHFISYFLICHWSYSHIDMEEQIIWALHLCIWSSLPVMHQLIWFISCYSTSFTKHYFIHLHWFLSARDVLCRVRLPLVHHQNMGTYFWRGCCHTDCAQKNHNHLSQNKIDQWCTSFIRLLEKLVNQLKNKNTNAKRHHWWRLRAPDAGPEQKPVLQRWIHLQTRKHPVSSHAVSTSWCSTNPSSFL